MEDFFQTSSGQILPSGSLMDSEASPLGDDDDCFLLLVIVVNYTCLRVYLAQIHVDLGSRFFQFLPDTSGNTKKKKKETTKAATRHLHLSFGPPSSSLDPPKNGEIALWPNTCVVKYKYCVSQKIK